MKNWLKKQGRLLLRYWFWVSLDDSRMKWNEFWISRNFNEYLKFRKFARYDELYEEDLPFTRQKSFIMIAMLHNYFSYLGYRGVVETDDFGIKYLIWRYTL
jgi:hypothetical protein